MDLNFNFKEIFSAFMVLFAVIDITGSTPVIIGLKDKGLKVEAGKAALLSSVIFLLFLFLGDAILSLFGVDIQSFAVAGSIIILILACEMVLDIEIFKYQGPGGSATIVPIIFPLIAGAGALTTVLSLRAEYHVENIIVAILLLSRQYTRNSDAPAFVRLPFSSMIDILFYSRIIKISTSN